MNDRAKLVEERMSRIGQRLQMTLSGLREVSRWTETLRRENPEEPQYADFDDRVRQLADDASARLDGILNVLKAAREQGAKSG
jgi:exonuclease III